MQISNSIKQKINTGEYQEKSIIPSEKDLMEINSVSRVTIRKAIDVLCKEHLLEPKAGYGTVVLPNRKTLSSFTEINSTTSELKERGIEERTLFANIDLIKIDAHFAEVSSFKAGTEVYNLQRTRGHSGKLIVFSNSFIKTNFQLDQEADLFTGSLYKILTRNNVVFSRFREEISAVKLTKLVANRLKLKEGDIGLKRVRYGYDANDDLIEYSESFYNPKLYSYVIDISN